MNAILVFIGGGLGSLCRYGIAVGVKHWIPAFPLATLLANVLSCVVLGLILGYEMGKEPVLSRRLLMITGFCGGFSTFSTFSNETLQLIHTGQYKVALLNILLNLLLCMSCIVLGIWLGRMVCG